MTGSRGEQSTMVMGEGRNPKTEHLLKLADEASIKKDHAVEIIKTIESCLAKWPTLAKQYGVHKTNIDLIDKKINQKS